MMADNYKRLGDYIREVDVRNRDLAVDKEHLPEGRRMGTLGEIADFAYGKMPDKTSKGSISNI